jgi:hypothetical protein
MPSSFKCLATIVFLCAGLAGCSQAEGDACQVDRDCDDGLVCQVSGSRGTCEQPEMDAGADDAGIDIDEPSFEDDAGFDPATDEDAG